MGVNKKKIVCIGSVHLDIIGDCDKHARDNRDKIGALHLTVGGTAFNVAVHLSLENNETYLFTYINKNLLFNKYIINRIEEYPIKCDYIYSHDEMPLSGYMTYTTNGKFDSAVSCMAIDSINFNENHLKQAIELSDMIFLECNLSSDQINLIVDIAHKTKKRLCISGVSDSKISRGINILRNEIVYDVFFMNEYEAKSVLGEIDSIKHQKSAYVCHTFKSRNVIITCGNNGFKVFTQNGNLLSFQTHFIKNTVSDIGAGDALAAAVCSHALYNDSIDWNECLKTINRLVAKVLTINSAVPPPQG